ncbi:PKD domain-containing protein, partial [Fulvivirga sp. RKSG066]|uniref:PKD domain-containing protein n=1 Tax=Fulvivirga aurantia TaxID=2529383 RepID=UPI0012BC093E
SDAAILTVEEEAVITANPVDVTRCEDATITFNVSASGAGLTYQWEEDNGGGFTPLADGGIYSGTNTATLTLDGITSAENGNQYRVVVSNTAVVCSASVTSASATLTVDEKPEIIDDPDPVTICEGDNTSFTINAGVTTNPTYQWQVSANGGSTYSNLSDDATYSGVSTAVLNIINAPATLNGNLYRARVNGKCTPSVFSQNALLDVRVVPVADAGSGGDECDLTFLLGANPSSGTGMWSQQAGPGTASYNNINSPNATVTVTAYGTYTFRWTETNAVCSDFDEIVVNFYLQPVADAGSDGNECDLDFNLAATPSVGIGTWSKAVGPGNISFSTNANDPNAIISVDAYGSYTFRWTENNNGCIDTDDVVVNFYEQPIADADRNNASTYDECDLNYLLDAVPSISGSTGLWSKVSGSGVATFANATSPTTNVSVSAFDTYVFEWVETNGVCNDSDQVVINFYEQPVANAGPGGVVCGLNFGLNAVPTVGIGTWSKVSGPGILSFSGINDPNATVTADAYGEYEIQWSEDNNGCVSSEIITVIYNEAPIVVSVDDDGTVLCAPGSISLRGEIGGGANTGTWSLISGGTGTLTASSLTGTTVTATYIVDPSEFGPLVFRLTTDDADGAGPCTIDFMETTITVNEAAEVNAGPDLDVCEDETSIELQGSFSGSTSSVTWSGGAGSFSDVNDPNADYFFDSSEIGTSVTLTLTTDDPDGAGPCVIVSDVMRVNVNPLPVVNFFNLPPVTNESESPITLVGNHAGGNFTITPGSGLGSTYIDNGEDKVSFDPGSAELGSNFVTYTFTDAKGCTNFNTQEVIVNPVTSNDFNIEGATTDEFGRLEICAEIGKLRLLGVPDPASGNPGTEFTSTESGFVTQEPNGDWVVNTDGLANGIYEVRYRYVNSFGAPSVAVKDVKVYASPIADIIVDNNCVVETIQFTDNSSIPAPADPSLADTILEWAWDFDDGTFSNQQNPMHTYDSPGIYNVELEVTTAFGCKSTTNQVVRVGSVPEVNFSWASICNGDATEFVNATPKDDPNAVITQLTWDFGDGESISGAEGDNVTPGTHGGRTFGTYTDPFHEYINVGNYDVTLTVETSDGCTSSIQQRIFILPFNVVTPSAENAYFEDFEAGSGGWVANALIEYVNDDTVASDTSWVYGEPTWAGNSQPGSNAWWTGDNSGSYYPNERSFMNGPCFDLTQLTRPMISMDIWYDVQDGFDGAVLQYSINGGINWVNVGTVDEGINWYDAQGLISRPGDRASIPNGPSNFNEGDKGWTGTSGGQWVSARYSLEGIPENERDFVRFRLAFATDANDPSTGPQLNGFAFDNVFIGNKSRTVLVEHFTDTEIEISNQSNQYLESIKQSQIAETGFSDFTTLQYHIDDSGEDPFYLANTGDPSARSLYYGVSQAPSTVMGGNQFNGNPFELTEVAIDRRSLEDPLFKVSIDTLSSADNIVSGEIEIEACDNLNEQVTVQLAVVEDMVDYSGITYQNVVRKLMLGGQGQTVNLNWTPGVSTTINAEWEVSTEIQDPNNLYLIGFVQNKTTREIYGTAIVKGPVKQGGPVTGLGNDLLEEVKQINIYPNPVNGVLNFDLPTTASGNYNWKVMDQRGITVLEGSIDFENGHYQANTESLTNGIYYVVIGAEDRPLMYKKIAVMNRE